jgi:hypothetical protein
MRVLPEPDYPSFVSDRLSAVSNVPTQFLVSVGMVTVILIAATLADNIPNTDGAAGFVDAQKTASVSANTHVRGRGKHATYPCLPNASRPTLVSK